MNIFNQAFDLHKQSKLTEAKELYEIFLDNNHNHSDALHLLGLIYYSLNQHVKAIELIQKAISIKSHEFYYNTLGNVLKAQNKFDDAIQMYEIALAKNPDYAEASYNLANLLQEKNRLDEAMEMYAKSLLLNPNNETAFYNLGIILHAQNRYNEAMLMYKKALAINPNYIDVYVNFGITLNAQNRVDEALLMYEKALSMNSNNREAQWNKSFTLLLKGDLTEGFKLYEWRYCTAQKRNFPQPLWLNDTPLDGKTILIHTDQGYGDTIQFCRYIEFFSKFNCNIIFEVEKPLLSFLSQIQGVSQFVEKGEKLPEFDFHCPLMTLPLAFKTDIRSILAKTSYLSADTKKVQEWSDRLGFTCKPKIGVVWSGNPSHNNDHNRTIELAKILQYLPEGFEYISLQKEIRESDKDALYSSKIRYFEDELHDFSDTAALCENMDFVISVDTSVAHLCAALGKETYVLLPFSPDWRWLLDRNDNPWYPTMHLLRQKEIGKWENPFEEILTILGNIGGKPYL